MRGQTRQPPVLPTDIQVVHTAEDLQSAVSSARNIEIRAHLDLRTLSRVANPQVLDAAGIRDRDVALLYAYPPLRSIRGNCTEPDGAAALSLTEDEAVDLLPLKPRQCLLMFDDTFLMINSGTLWLHNLYLKLSASTRRPFTAFVLGGKDGKSWSALARSDTYVTNVTFNSHPLRIAAAVKLDQSLSSTLLSDCIFVDWAGDEPMLEAKDRSLMAVQSTVFWNVLITGQANIVDVSHGGTALLSQVALANVHSSTASVVGTTCNDYYNEYCACPYLYESQEYGDSGGTSFNAYVTPVDERDRSMFGEEFLIKHEFVSDCAHVPSKQSQASVVLPGCTETPVASLRVSAGQACVDSDMMPAQTMRDQGYSEAGAAPQPSAPIPALLSTTKPTRAVQTCVPRWKGGSVVPPTGLQANDADVLCEATLLSFNDPWFVALQEELSDLSVAPVGWPEFTVRPTPATSRTSHLQTSLSPVQGGPSSLVQLLDTHQPPAPSASDHARDDRIAWERASPDGNPVLGGLVWLVVLLVLGAAAATAVWRCRLKRLKDRGARSRGMPRCIHCLPCATSRQRCAQKGPCSGTLPATHPPPGTYEIGSEASAAHSIVQAQWPRRADLQLNGRRGRSGGGSVMPASAMNSAYEYSLPRHLALLQSQQPPSHSGSQTSFQDADNECDNSVPKTDGTGIPGTSRERWPDDGQDTEDSMLPMPPTGITGSTSCNVLASGDAGTFSSVHSTTRQTNVTSGTQDDHPARNHCNRAADRVTSCARADCTHTSYGNSLSHVKAASEEEGGPKSYSSSKKCTAVSVSSQTADVGLVETLREADSGCPSSAESTTDLASSAAVTCQLACDEAGCETAPNCSTVDRNGCQEVDSADESRGRNARMHSLQMQLDLFREEDVFLERFSMLGREHRRRGGQAVVQFAEDREGVAYALKFFLEIEAFHSEADLYAACSTATQHPRTGSVPGMPAGPAQFLPRVESMCKSSSDPRGALLPPCIVMEKGESLQEWCNRAEPDLFASIAVLSHVSARLADMHEAGYVHRDVKPANVMWLPRENRWTVIDFGCTARRGERVALAFTLTYAAPEVVRVFVTQQPSVEASPAVDAWALGVMAFELLTGAPAFQPLTHGCDSVVEMLRGNAALPWEGALSTQHAHQLGVLKGPVMQLLQRDAAARPPLRAFHSACSSLFSSSPALVA